MLSHHRSSPAADRANWLAVGRHLLLVLLTAATQVHAQPNKKAVPPVIADSDALVAFTSDESSSPSGGLVALASAAGQPDLPTAISPLRIEPDPNDVNLVSGKTTMNIPVLSVPGAGNLQDYGKAVPVYGIGKDGAWVIRPGARVATGIYGARPRK